MRPVVCPKCPRRIRLRPLNALGVVADACPRCFGVWFDEHELEAVRDRLSSDARWKNIEFWGMGEETHFSPAAWDCPRCETPVSSIRCRTVDLEFCINCAGVWLDAGELRAVLAGLEREVNEAPASSLVAEILRQLGEIPGGRKGVVEEVRDFLAANRMLSIRLAVENPTLVEKAATLRAMMPF